MLISYISYIKNGKYLKLFKKSMLSRNLFVTLQSIVNLSCVIDEKDGTYL